MTHLQRINNSTLNQKAEDNDYKRNFYALYLSIIKKYSAGKSLRAVGIIVHNE